VLLVVLLEFQQGFWDHYGIAIITSFKLAESFQSLAIARSSRLLNLGGARSSCHLFNDLEAAIRILSRPFFLL